MLKHTADNHKSALEFPEQIKAYIDKELKLGALIGPFHTNPLDNNHCSPLMTRPKANSEARHVIMDLSWSKGYSVNDGVDKDGHLDSNFSLTFPTVDHLTDELVKIGRGAHIFKVDISRAFRHLKVDPLDIDLLGLNWEKHYFDTCVPFGTRHGSQFFQCTSDAVRYIMRQHGRDVINYIDDFLGFGTPSVARASFDVLHDVMCKLGLTISEKKLVEPTTRAVCLGVLIDTVEGTIAIPPEKLENVRHMIDAWATKKHCSKKELQSLLGHLLYVHKCVKPARCFVNHMLDVLYHANNPNSIPITDEFQRDIC